MSAEIIRPCVLSVISPFVVIDDREVVAVCTDGTIAKRLMELWDRYGLVDVPDTAEGVAG